MGTQNKCQCNKRRITTCVKYLLDCGAFHGHVSRPNFLFLRNNLFFAAICFDAILLFTMQLIITQQLLFAQQVVFTQQFVFTQGAEGVDTRSDPGDISRYRRRRSSINSSRAGAGSNARRYSSRPGMDMGSRTNTETGDEGSSAKRYLNGRITKLHNVRAEPIKDAAVVGYLVATKEVSVGGSSNGT